MLLTVMCAAQNKHCGVIKLPEEAVRPKIALPPVSAPSYEFCLRTADTLSLLFIGDVMTHIRQIEYAYTGGDRSDASNYDYSSYFTHIRPMLDSVDFAVANMEFPCGVRPFSGYPCFSAPESLAEEAQRSGIDLFLSANNHICDKGRAGIDSTIAIYTRLGTPFTGLFSSEEDNRERNPFMANIRGVKVAFINITYGTNGIPVPKPHVVGNLDTVRVKEAIGRAKARGAQYIIVLPHWGEEYHLDCSRSQERFADFLYRNGVNSIVGSHPHVVQKVTYDGSHVTAYSLGNFISNMSIDYGQIGMVCVLKIVRETDGTLTTLAPEVTYTWCGRGGLLEKNYTTVPIEEWLGRKSDFISPSQYDKMVREWNALKKKFNIE